MSHVEGSAWRKAQGWEAGRKVWRTSSYSVFCLEVGDREGPGQ